MALDGKTPSEEAGITIDGDNKWVSLMKTALRNKKAHSEVVKINHPFCATLNVTPPHVTEPL